MNISELTNSVSAKALLYLQQTDEEITVFPISIVDFVIEYVRESCHFPKHFSESKIADILSSGVNSLAMACVDIYVKAGAEGESQHEENNTQRTYKSAWITFDLMSNFPNFVSTLW